MVNVLMDVFGKICLYGYLPNTTVGYGAKFGTAEKTHTAVVFHILT